MIPMLLPAGADSVHLGLVEALQPLALSVDGSTLSSHLLLEIVLIVHLEARLRDQSVGRFRVNASLVCRFCLKRLKLATNVTISVNALHSALILFNLHLAIIRVVLQSVKGQRGVVVVISAISPSQHIVKL